MNPERQREIARKGGASVPPEKRSFSTDRSLAVQAGRKGGENSSSRRGKQAPERPRPQDDFGIHPMR